MPSTYWLRPASYKRVPKGVNDVIPFMSGFFIIFLKFSKLQNVTKILPGIADNVATTYFASSSSCVSSAFGEEPSSCIVIAWIFLLARAICFKLLFGRLSINMIIPFFISFFENPRSRDNSWKIVSLYGFRDTSIVLLLSGKVTC